MHFVAGLGPDGDKLSLKPQSLSDLICRLPGCCEILYHELTPGTVVRQEQLLGLESRQWATLLQIAVLFLTSAEPLEHNIGALLA